MTFLAALSALKALGPHPDGDALLGAFVDAVAARGLSPYPAQEEAFLELAGRKNVVLCTPTGSGKSLVAAALHFSAMAQQRRSYYTCPIKALVNEKFFALCKDFGAGNVGMQTGDASINPGAPIVCCTAEVLANLALREGARAKVDDVVVDEFHYYADRERGAAWQIPLLALPQARFLLMSATIGNPDFFAEKLTLLNGLPSAVVASKDRPVPLDFTYQETPLFETIPELLSEQKAPIYVVSFTQRGAAEEAQNVMSLNFSSKDDKRAIAEALYDLRFDTPYGKEVAKFVRHGMGIHHAGLLPKYRLLVEKLAQQGLLKVICGTDTLGVGVNIPIRTVLLTKLCKYDGEKTGILSVRDFHQISGRAGRKGFDDRGSVVVQAPEHVIENLRIDQKQAAQPNKKLVKKRPPDKGYVAWDRKTFERLIGSEPEPLVSQFDLDHGFVLNVLANPDNGGYRRVLELIARAHVDDRARRRMKQRAALLFRSLLAAGVLRVEEKKIRLGIELQDDFSIHHTLALYLLDTLPALDPSSESYALDVCTLAESIAESPTAILMRQVDRLKDEKMAAMKAEGVPYEERLEALDKIEHPKPLRELIYDSFNAFSAKHPWVGTENIRPKSIARDLYETYASFNDYVRDYGLQRVEGTLLRYLAEVHKLLAQTVPDAAKTEGLHELIAFLHTMIRQVDRSLLDEWTTLQHPELRTAAPDVGHSLVPPPAIDEKVLVRRVRSELHRLVQLLARRQYEEAAELVRSCDSEPWTAARFEQAMAPFFAEHAQLITTPEARKNEHSRFDKQGDARWRVTQTLLDPAGHNEWHVEAAVNPLAADDQVAPLLGIIRIGS